MIVYQTNHEGIFVGYVEADESPLEPGKYLLPGGCIKKEPPTFSSPNRARWDKETEDWIIEPTPEEEIEVQEPSILPEAPLERLRMFLQNNPDIAKALTNEK